MGFSFSPYVVVMLSAAIVCAVICVHVWLRWRDNSEALPLVLLMLACVEWLTASALGFAGLAPSAKMLWAKIEYIGVASVPLLVLVLSLSHSDLKQWLNPGRVIMLSVIPVLTVILAWTNELHGLVWASYTPYLENGMMFSNKVYGAWFWIYWAYSYILLLMSTVIIVRSVFASGGLFRWQGILLLAGILAPWVGNAMYVLHVSPLANLDLTPLAFSFTGILLALGMVRWGLFNIKPVAHSAVIGSMADGLVVLDGRNRVVDINSSARSALAVSAADAVGKPADRILPVPLSSIPNWDSDDGQRGFEVMLKSDGRERYYEITKTPFHERRGALRGSVVTLHDLTEYKRMEERLYEAERRESREALHESEDKYRTILEEMGDAYFEVDLAGNFSFVNKATCLSLGYTREALIGMNFRAVTAPENIKMVFEAYNQVYREQKPNTIISYSVVRKNGETGYVETLASLLRDRRGQAVGFRCVGRDITERKKAEEKLEKSYATLKKTLNDAINTMVKIVEMRDPYTAGHQMRVADLAAAIAREMQIKDEQVDRLHMAAVVHDIGKMYVPADILSKPGKLGEVEFRIVKTHAQGGYDIVKGMDFHCTVAQSILQHHERLDGSGYPNGLAGADIIIEARILAVADVVEAMASHRPYRAALGIDKALEEICAQRGKLYDTDVVDACLRLFKEKKFAFGENDRPISP
jgi:PAS domain S-box-containing protein/putative nucleotidyltransferase with HDIG domain